MNSDNVKRLIKILAVDDSAFMLTAITKMIRSDPELDVVSTARDGYKALFKLSQTRVDLIIGGVNMPDMDGLEFVRNLNDMKLEPPIPIIMITTEGTESKVADILSFGAIACIAKPFTSDQLREKIGRVFAT